MKKSYALFLILVSFFASNELRGMNRFFSQLFCENLDRNPRKRLRDLHKIENQIHSLENLAENDEYIDLQKLANFYNQAVEWYARELQNPYPFSRESIIEKGTQMIEVRDWLRKEYEDKVLFP